MEKLKLSIKWIQYKLLHPRDKLNKEKFQLKLLKK